MTAECRARFRCVYSVRTCELCRELAWIEWRAKRSEESQTVAETRPSAPDRPADETGEASE